MRRPTPGVAGAGARAEARHGGRPAVAPPEAALQHRLHVLVFGCFFGRLDALRLVLLHF